MRVKITEDLGGMAKIGNEFDVTRVEKGFVVLTLKNGDEFVVSDEDYETVGGASASPSPSMSSEESSVIDALLSGTYSSEYESDRAAIILAEKKAVKEARIEERRKAKEAKAKEEQEKADALQALKDSMSANQFFFTTFTGGKLPSSKLDHIITAYEDEHFPVEHRVDIPEIDESYIWNVEVLEMLILAHKLNKKCLLTGMPGTGKSTAVKQFAAIMKQPYMRFNGKDGVEPASFLGYPWAGKHGMEWKDGLLPIGVKAGYLTTIDEVFKLPAGINMAMQNLYEQDGSLLLDDKPGDLGDKLCEPHDDFRLFLTDNVLGTGDSFSKYAATQIQDTSTLDRFALTIEVEYLSVEDECTLLMRKKEKVNVLKKADIKKLVKFAGLVRNAFAEDNIAITLSPRGLLSIIELTNNGIPVATAIQYCFSNKVAEDNELGAVKQFLDTCGIK